MDGTIVDTERLWTEAQNALLADHGLPPLGAQDEERLVGASWEETSEVLTAAGLRINPAEASESITRRVLQGMREALSWRPGARELLAALKQAGVPCALVTNSFASMAQIVTEQLPPGTITVTVTLEDVRHGKPAPEPYLLAAERLRVPAAGCVAIEDSATGLASAIAAGCAAIGVPHGMRLDPAGPYRLLPSLRDVTPATLAAILRDTAAEAPA